MLIGDLARLSDISPATIRYYEELGLLTAPPRSEAGYRHYSETTIDELRFIKKGQGLGFSLEEIGEILKISRAGEAPCSHVLDLAQRNLAAAEAAHPAPSSIPRSSGRPDREMAREDHVHSRRVVRNHQLGRPANES